MSTTVCREPLLHRLRCQCVRCQYDAVIRVEDGCRHASCAHTSQNALHPSNHTHTHTPQLVLFLWGCVAVPPGGTVALLVRAALAPGGLWAPQVTAMLLRHMPRSFTIVSKGMCVSACVCARACCV